MWTDKSQVIEGPGGYRFNVLEHLAGIAPYFDSPGVQLDPSPPDGCTVTKATYIARHSNIFANDVCAFYARAYIAPHNASPSQFDYETYLSPFLSKLANYSDRSVFTSAPDLAFLANYTSPITNETEQIEKMTPSGGDAAAAFAGVIKQTYASLLNSTKFRAGAFRIWAASGSENVLPFYINMTKCFRSEQRCGHRERLHWRSRQ